MKIRPKEPSKVGPFILPASVRLDAEELTRTRILSVSSPATRGLRKAGRQYVGLCPFHSERHPSFYVEPDRKLWNCFGCGLGGDVLSFVMRVEDCNFVSALRFLVSGHPNLSNSPNVSSRVPHTPPAPPGILRGSCYTDCRLSSSPGFIRPVPIALCR